MLSVLPGVSTSAPWGSEEGGDPVVSEDFSEEVMCRRLHAGGSAGEEVGEYSRQREQELPRSFEQGTVGLL